MRATISPADCDPRDQRRLVPRVRAVRFPAPRLRPGLVRGRCLFGQPFFISEYDSSETVERDFERLVPCFLRLLMFPTSEFFCCFFVAMEKLHTKLVPI
jgi:hypothetical protein